MCVAKQHVGTTVPQSILPHSGVLLISLTPFLSFDSWLEVSILYCAGRSDLCVSWLLCQDTYPAEGGASTADRESYNRGVIKLLMRDWRNVEQCISLLWQCKHTSLVLWLNSVDLHLYLNLLKCTQMNGNVVCTDTGGDCERWRIVVECHLQICTAHTHDQLGL